ncbi:MAG TPA: polysaccharide biosynthesis/export family protein [Acidobacteriaceae bacterium]
MKWKRFLTSRTCSVALCWLAAAAAVAQSGPAGHEYKLGPGDRIVCHVEDMEEISEKPLKIDPNGYIDLPMAGRLQASGLTVDQLKAAMAERLSKYIDAPAITINLVENQSRPVSIIGAVNSPGVHQLEGPKRLIEVISLAGGLRQDAGSVVILTRDARWGVLPLPGAREDESRSFSTARLSLDGLLGAKNPAENIEVQPEDVIAIPKADIIYVVGNVKRSGGFPLSQHETMSLLQAISLAEGLDKDAASKDAKIIRPSATTEGKPLELPVNIQAVLAGKAPDQKLYANDVLFIPNSAVKSSSRRLAEAVLQAATGVAIYAH